ncbi:MAG TPA: N-6 DNA methylase [Solirubrobacterales bacterium]
MPVNTAIQIDAQRVNYGEVFTRRWVVDLILDLSGYTPDKDLANLVVIEPACGSGAFLVALVERLIKSAKRHGRDLAAIRHAIVARDLQAHHVAKSRAVAREALTAAGFDSGKSQRMARKWIQKGDFLLDPPAEQSADLVVGNPPYIRLEHVSPRLSSAYREACPTMGGRSDVYIGFYERGLAALCDEGILGFICADRWMRNAYGASLRNLIGSKYAVDAIVSMTAVDAFEDEVNAYPAITILRRGEQDTGPFIANAKPHFSADDAGRLIRVAAGRRGRSKSSAFSAARMPRWFQGTSGWPHGSPTRLAAIATLEGKLPTLEDPDRKTRVGIGLATGADRIFVTDNPNLVEPERMLPMAMVRDLAGGNLNWSGHYLINPWDEEGLIDLDRWPAMKAHLSTHEAALRKRHTAKKTGKWHKTIDRVLDGLAESPKLYLPDFKESIFPVLDHGKTYPHHNLYWITSDEWDLEVLGGILLSDVSNMFIDAYSVRMRGGYLRFQAQYLRRIRVPRPDQVGAHARRALRDAFRSRDREKANHASLRLYGLSALPS